MKLYHLTHLENCIFLAQRPQFNFSNSFPFKYLAMRIHDTSITGTENVLTFRTTALQSKRHSKFSIARRRSTGLASLSLKIATTVFTRYATILNASFRTRDILKLSRTFQEHPAFHSTSRSQFSVPSRRLRRYRAANDCNNFDVATIAIYFDARTKLHSAPCNTWEPSFYGSVLYSSKCDLAIAPRLAMARDASVNFSIDRLAQLLHQNRLV